MRWILAAIVFWLTLSIGTYRMSLEIVRHFEDAWEQRVGDRCQATVPLFRNHQCWNGRLRVDRQRED